MQFCYKMTKLSFVKYIFFTKKVRINPNHPKSFKILYMLLYDFGGFRIVECSYHVFTGGLMSQLCLSTKKFGYCTV